MMPYKIHRVVGSVGLLVGSHFPSPALAGPLNDTGTEVCRDHVGGADTAVSATTTCQPQQ